MRHSLLILSLFAALRPAAQPSTTPTYHKAIAQYSALAQSHPNNARLLEVGSTDAGLPLHLFIIDPSGLFDPARSRQNGDLVWLTMNGIHPGEPCGIDASLIFAEAKLSTAEPGMVYLIIPVYNVGGALNRNSTSRVNQNGPDEYGFRGNAKNLDLNRDFIKSDALNTFAFTEIFQQWQPHIFLDTHTSNGADYQPNISLINTVPERLHPMQARLLSNDLLPKLYRSMKEAGEPMLPYVYTRNGLPESGLKAFTDLPRYSTGYASLWGCIGLITEAHMLKPYDARVQATLQVMQQLDTLLQANKANILAVYKVAQNSMVEQRTFATRFQLTDVADSVLFAGYRADSVKSGLSGLPRLRYNRDKPFSEKVAYFNSHEVLREYSLPEAFVIPRAWREVIERLTANGIEMTRLATDTMITVTASYVQTYQTVDEPYEGRYLHYNTEVVERETTLYFSAGDVLVPCRQKGNRYLAHVLDPVSDDSFFNWGFFDAVLMQKEYFSAYLFEDTALEILNRNTMLKKAYEEKKRSDPAFAADGRAQLDYVYKNSKYYEDSHMRLPVYRIERK